MSDHTVYNGSFKSELSEDDRFVVAPGILEGLEDLTLTVKPDGPTAAFVRTGIKWPGNRRVILYVGQMDDVRCYVVKHDKKLHVIMTKEILQP